MNAEGMRHWGLIASWVALAVALVLAVAGGAPKQAAPVPAAAPAPAAPAEPLTFTIRFADDDAFAEAQTLAAMGETARATRQVERILPQRRELGGLCFVRFSAGADMVLKPCAPLNAAGLERARRIWSTRFRAMPQVSYAEASVILQNETK